MTGQSKERQMLRLVITGAAVVSGIDAQSLLSPDRRPELVQARAAVAVVLRAQGWPLGAIGAALGGRQASTIARSLPGAPLPLVAALFVLMRSYRAEAGR